VGGRRRPAGHRRDPLLADAGGYFLGDYEGLVTTGTTFGAFFDQTINQATNPSDAYYTTLSPAP
jgi:hypothetical protein